MDQDVIIIGAGVVGLCQALSLVRMGFKVTLCDRRLPDLQDLQDYDPRVYAITRASEGFLSQLDVWQDIKSQRISPYREMFVWDASGEGEIRFDCREVALSNLGYIVEHKVIINALLKALRQSDNFQLVQSQSLLNIRYDEGNVILHTEDSSYRAKLMIGADGANSWLRQQLSVKISQWDYEQQAIVATVNCELSHNKTARQCFMPSGPLAFLPLDDDNVNSIVWSTETKNAEKLMALSDEAFCQALTEVFSKELGQVIKVTERYSFPLSMQHAHNYTADRIALVGDALHTIHPLAGQGLNLGIADVAALSKSISQAIDTKQEFCSRRVLRRFERSRKAHNWEMVATMEAFKRLFSNDNGLLTRARNAGLSLCDRSRFVKRVFIDKAMGA